MRIYVGNLPYSVDNQQLLDLLKKDGAGVRSAEIVYDRESGNSKGYGFAEVEEADATYLIDRLNGSDYGGRNIVVNKARERAARKEGGGGKGRRDRDW